MAGPDLSALTTAATPAAPPDLTKVGASPAATSGATSAPDLTKLATPTASAAPDLTQLATPSAAAPAQPKKDEPGFGSEMLHIGAEHVVGIVDQANAMMKSPSILGKAWHGLGMVGEALSVPFTPVQTALQETAGRGLEYATGGAVPKHLTGELATLGAMFFLDPLGGLGTAGKLIRGSKVARDIESRLSPTTMSETAGGVEHIIRKQKSSEATAVDRVKDALGSYEGAVNKLPMPDKVAFMDRIMMGVAQPDARLGAVDAVYRGQLAEANNFLRSVEKTTGEPVVKQFNDDYLGIVWEPKDEAAREAEKALRQSNRPFLGSQAFRRPKTYQTVSQGLADANFIKDFRLATESPVQMMEWKFAEMYRYGYAKLAEHELKNSGIPIWMPYYKTAAPNLTQLADRIFNPVLAPFETTVTAEHATTYDPRVWDGLHRIADAMGFRIDTPLLSDGDKTLAVAHGYSTPPGARDPRVVSLFGNHMQTLEHEVGHKLDDAFNLWGYMSKDKTAWRELGELGLLRLDNVSFQTRQASLRFINQAYPYVSPSVNRMAYLLSGPERMANFFHAYWYAPDILRQTAPNALKNFEQWMATQGQMQTQSGAKIADLIRSVRPSLRSSDRDIRKQVFNIKGFGLRIPGKWMMDVDAARVFNNFVTPSSFNTPAFQTLRKFGMSLNMLQLGLSAFHATFTTVDVMVSQMGRAITSAMQGHFGDAAIQALATPTAAFTTVGRGAKLRENLLKSDAARALLSQEEKAVMQMFNLGGGRIYMDTFHRGAEASLIGSWRNGRLMNEVARGLEDHPYKEVLALPFKIAGRAISDMSHPVMDYLVPRQKLGVFQNMALDWIRRNPGATEQEMAKAATKMWDSVDNRLGQMVYDNVFWTKTFKDLAFMSVRSVGWNLGTIRELGGGGLDFARAVVALRRGDQVEFTHRMAYAMAMPIVTGTIGAAMTYLYTGHGPTEMLDYFFPPTGRRTPHGAKERVGVPSYNKDVLEWNLHPVQTALSKMNPTISMAMMLYDNKDFWGGLIHDPQGSFVSQMKDYRDFFIDQATPFSVRGARRLSKEKGGVTQQVGSFFGFQPAPAFIVDPKRGEAYQRKQELMALKRRAKERAQQ